jgi:UDP:flavonoid glycosyltransferase YjiC (YdhE family)
VTPLTLRTRLTLIYAAILSLLVSVLSVTYYRVLALQPPGFDHRGPLPDNTTYVGAIRRPGNTPQLDRRLAGRLAEPGNPWVLLSLSTTLHGQADAALVPGRARRHARPGAADARGVLTWSRSTPPPTTVCGHVPHEAVAHVAVVVTHAGMSTVATTLGRRHPHGLRAAGRTSPQRNEWPTSEQASTSPPTPQPANSPPP